MGIEFDLGTINLIKMSNHKFISSIYNYCDRWCSRCVKIAYCRVFADEQQQGLSPEELDVRNEKFWMAISKRLSETAELLEKMAAEIGINPDDPAFDLNISSKD